MSDISKYTKEELQQLVDSSSTYAEILLKIGKKVNTGTRKTLNKYIEFFEINEEGLKKRLHSIRSVGIKKHMASVKQPLQNIMCKNSSVNSNEIKKRVISEGILQNKCVLCGQLPFHNGKELVLQLDHIDGDHTNNTFENLRILCPNCHTQTPTWGTKKREQDLCIDCGKVTQGFSKKCRSCSSIECNEKNRKFDVSKEELEKLLYEMPLTKIGKKFGVTDNSIRKRCKTLNIKVPIFERGHWIKNLEVRLPGLV